MTVQPHPQQTPVESVNDAIRRIMAEGGTSFQIEQRLTRYFVERHADLLEALKALLEWSTSEYQSNPRIDAQAKAAIAKAEAPR